MSQLSTEQAYQQAAGLHREGRANEAETMCRRILESDARHPKALHLLGVIAHQTGRNELAAKCIREAIAADPSVAQMHNNLGNVLTQLGDFDGAIAACRQAISLNANSAAAWSNLGNALRAKGQAEAAASACRQAIALNPNLAEAHSNLGNALSDLRQMDDAIAAYQKALQLNPAFAEAYNNLATAFMEKCQPDKAISACEQAIALAPNYADAFSNLGSGLQARGDITAAIRAFNQAITLDAAHASAHMNLGCALLSIGDFAQGWREYEWRWKCEEFASSRPNFNQPQWDGSPLLGRTLLLHNEQGLGDTLQFVRYAALAAGRGGNVIVQCQPELQRLVETMRYGCIVVPSGCPLPPFDVHCPLMSLPNVLGTTLATIPRDVPYFQAEKSQIEKWRARVASANSTLRVGLAWAGNPKHRNDLNRSIPLAALGPLLRSPRIAWYSLQKNRPADAGTLPPQLIDLTNDLADFADTAALMANLDLVITADTAIAHLAGALGKPAWTLLPHVAEWRWMQSTSDSPWYPTMRLFRQTSADDWSGLMDRVAHALAQLP